MPPPYPWIIWKQVVRRRMREILSNLFPMMTSSEAGPEMVNSPARLFSSLIGMIMWGNRGRHLKARKKTENSILKIKGSPRGRLRPCRWRPLASFAVIVHLHGGGPACRWHRKRNVGDVADSNPRPGRIANADCPDFEIHT